MTVKFPCGHCKIYLIFFFFLIVVEWGDDVKALSEDEAMVLVNHQATGDVCTLMMCLQDKGTVGYSQGVGQPLWAWDALAPVCCVRMADSPVLIHQKIPRP